MKFWIAVLSAGSSLSIRVILFVMITSCLSVRLQAQIPEIPSHPSDLVFSPLEFVPPKSEDHRHVLSNGAIVYVVEDHTFPVVDVSVMVRVGSYLEPPDRAGLARLTGSLMRTGGTTNMSAADFDEEVAFLASQIGSSIAATQGRASLGCLTKDLDQALALFFDMLRKPSFEQSRLDLAKSQAFQAMERRNDSTASIGAREWGRLIRGDEHFSTQAETRTSIETITREELINFHQRYYHPSGFIFSVSGDVETEEIIAKLEEHMSGWDVAPTEVPSVPRPEYVPAPGLYLVDKPDVNQGRVYLGHLGTTRDNPDHYAILVMTDILGGGGFTSRMMTRVRSDEGLAYSVGAAYSLGVYYDGVFMSRFESRSETVARATAIVLGEIDRIRNEEVSEDELQTAIASFVETFSMGFAQSGSVANLFANNEYTERDSSYLETYRDRISSVTPQDVLRVAKEYLHPEKLIILAVGNLDSILEGDPDNPSYSLEDLSAGAIERIPLPEPFTMDYPEED